MHFSDSPGLTWTTLFANISSAIPHLGNQKPMDHAAEKCLSFTALSRLSTNDFTVHPWDMFLPFFLWHYTCYGPGHSEHMAILWKVAWTWEPAAVWENAQTGSSNRIASWQLALLLATFMYWYLLTWKRIREVQATKVYQGITIIRYHKHFPHISLASAAPF